MGAVPRSLLTAVRDLAALAAIAWPACLAVTYWSMRRDAEPAVLLGLVSPDLPWRQAVPPSLRWTLSVLAWVLVVWCASRARAGRRSVWVPGALASVVVMARAAANLAPGSVRFLMAIGDWPGPALPYTLDRNGAVVLLAGHPAWAYPPLVVALLTAGAWLGARAGRAADDAASRHAATASGPGIAVAAVVAGLPALGGLGGAVVAHLAEIASPYLTTSDSVVLLVLDLGMPALIVLAAAALLSGTGRLGALATALVAWPVVTGPLLGWWGGGGDLELGQSAGLAVAVVAVALWRPAATWGNGALATINRPGALDRPAPAAPVTPEDAATTTPPGASPTA